METAGNDLTLTNLPPDVIRRIIRIEGSTMEEMHLISRSWNAMVLEFLHDRENFPLIEYCKLFPTQVSAHFLFAQFVVEKQNVKYLKRLLRNDCDVKEVNQKIAKVTTHWHLSDDPNETKREKDNVEAVLHMTRVLLRFSAIRTLGMIHVSMQQLTVIEKALRFIRIDELVISSYHLYPTLRTFTLKISKMKAIEEITFRLEHCENHEICELLLEMSKHVSLIFLKQRGPRIRANGELFKKTLAYWTALADQMIANGMKFVLMKKRSNDIVSRFSRENAFSP